MKSQDSNIKAILFDKDGVLIDSIDTCFSAFNETLRYYSENELTKEDYIRECWGKKAEVNLAKIFKDVPEDERNRIVKHYIERRMELNFHTRLYPNVIPVLEALSGRYSLGVITNTLKEMAIKILNHFNIYGYFDVVVSGDEGRPKPAPDLILKACKIICVQPEASYFVGDTMADVQAGKAAGCKTIILSTSIQREELEEFDEIIVIDDLIEILKII